MGTLSAGVVGAAPLTTAYNPTTTGGMNPNMDMEDPAAQAVMAEINFQDTIRTYNGLTDRCFTLCAKNFARKNLDQMEDKCVDKCVTKFLAAVKRMQFRFAE